MSGKEPIFSKSWFRKSHPTSQKSPEVLPVTIEIAALVSSCLMQFLFLPFLPFRPYLLPENKEISVAQIYEIFISSCFSHIPAVI